APGRLRFGEDLHASDLFQVLLHLEGVVNVCLTRFKRVGNQYPDHSADGLIRLEGLEIAVCDNDPRRPSRGFYRLQLHGGRRGSARSPISRAGTAPVCGGFAMSRATPRIISSSCAPS